jgi:CRP-like cAMP-binding protein
MGPGTSFGELALIYNCSRSCSVKAFGDVILIGLDKPSYLKHFGESVTAKVDVIKDFLKVQTVNLKHHLSMDKLDILSTKLIVKKFPQNYIV